MGHIQQPADNHFPKDGKKTFFEIPLQVHHCLLGLMLLPVSPLGKNKSCKAMMDLGREPREGISASLVLIISWLLAVAYIYIYIYMYSVHTVYR